MTGRDLAREVSPPAPVPVGGTDSGAIATDGGASVGTGGDRIRIAMIDTGVKRSILRQLTRTRGRRDAVSLHIRC